MTKPIPPSGVARVHLGGDVVTLRTRPSLTRSASSRRARLRQEALKGNDRALKHGINADLLNLPHVADEVALIYAVNPDLHPLQDLRLVELCASTQVAHRRALIAIEKDGMDPTLLRYEGNLGARLERHLAAVHERAQQRRREARQAEAVDLSGYRPKAVTR